VEKKKKMISVFMLWVCFCLAVVPAYTKKSGHQNHVLKISKKAEIILENRAQRKLESSYDDSEDNYSYNWNFDFNFNFNLDFSCKFFLDFIDLPSTIAEFSNIVSDDLGLREITDELCVNVNPMVDEIERIIPISDIHYILDEVLNEIPTIDNWDAEEIVDCVWNSVKHSFCGDVLSYSYDFFNFEVVDFQDLISQLDEIDWEKVFGEVVEVFTSELFENMDAEQDLIDFCDTPNLYKDILTNVIDVIQSVIEMGEDGEGIVDDAWDFVVEATCNSTSWASQEVQDVVGDITCEVSTESEILSEVIEYVEPFIADTEEFVTAFCNSSNLLKNIILDSISESDIFSGMEPVDESVEEMLECAWVDVVDYFCDTYLNTSAVSLNVSCDFDVPDEVFGFLEPIVEGYAEISESLGMFCNNTDELRNLTLTALSESEMEALEQELEDIVNCAWDSLLEPFCGEWHSSSDGLVFNVTCESITEIEYSYLVSFMQPILSELVEEADAVSDFCANSSEFKEIVMNATSEFSKLFSTVESLELSIEEIVECTWDDAVEPICEAWTSGDYEVSLNATCDFIPDIDYLNDVITYLQPFLSEFAEGTDSVTDFCANSSDFKDMVIDSITESDLFSVVEPIEQSIKEIVECAWDDAVKPLCEAWTSGDFLLPFNVTCDFIPDMDYLNDIVTYLQPFLTYFVEEADSVTDFCANSSDFKSMIINATSEVDLFSVVEPIEQSVEEILDCAWDEAIEPICQAWADDFVLPFNVTCDFIPDVQVLSDVLGYLESIVSDYVEEAEVVDEFCSNYTHEIKNEVIDMISEDELFSLVNSIEHDVQEIVDCTWDGIVYPLCDGWMSNQTSLHDIVLSDLEESACDISFSSTELAEFIEFLKPFVLEDIGSEVEAIEFCQNSELALQLSNITAEEKIFSFLMENHEESIEDILDCVWEELSHLVCVDLSNLFNATSSLGCEYISYFPGIVDLLELVAFDDEKRLVKESCELLFFEEVSELIPWDVVVDLTGGTPHEAEDVVSCAWDVLIESACNTTNSFPEECNDFYVDLKRVDSSCHIRPFYATAELDSCNATKFASELFRHASQDEEESCRDVPEAVELMECLFNHSAPCNKTCEAAPSPISAELNKFGTSVSLTFDGKTNYGTRNPLVTAVMQTFPCEFLLDFDGADDVACSWLSTQTLTVGTNGGLELYPMDTLVVLGGYIASSKSVGCGSEDYTLKKTNLTITVPDDAISPTIIFSSVSEIYDSCEDVTLDVSASQTGNLPVYSWSLVKTSASNSSEVAALLNAESSSSVFIANSHLSGGDWYTVEVTVTNVFSYNASASFNFSMAASAVPTLTMNGGLSHSTYSYNSFSLTARGAASMCGGDSSCTTALTYSWSVYEGSQLLSIPYTASFNTFTVSSGIFNASTTYKIHCKVTDCFDASNTAIITLTVLQSDLVAIISGGTMRTISEAAPFILDGTDSYDPDGGDITYWWNCTDALGDACDRNVSGSSSKLTVGAGALPDSSSREPYTVTLYVQSESAEDTRITTAQQWIYVESEAVPFISITTTDTKFNPTEDFVITAKIDTTDGAVYAEWDVGTSSTSFEYGNSLNANVKGPTHKSYSLDSYNGLATYNLVLKKGSIDDVGSSYTLSLTATFSSGASSMAEITFVSNAAPNFGTITVSPDTGYVMQTNFEASLSGWVDDDTPLRYAFMKQCGQGSNSQVFSIESLSYANSVDSFTLPEGNNYVIGVIVDAYGAEATITSSKISVTLNTEVSTANLTSMASAALSSAFIDGDYDSIASTLAVLTSSVVDTSIDCVAAPWSMCMTLNRANCSETENTCGSCMEGYSGKSGDANSACVSTTECNMDGIVGGNETDIDCGGLYCAPCEDGSSCLKNSDCESDICTDNVCVEETKACPSANGKECNGAGAGTCYYKHQMSGQDKPASWCGESNVMCMPYCVCNDTYTGSACSMNAAEQAAALEAVQLVFTQVDAVMDALGDAASSDDIEIYAAILSSSCGDATVFDEDTASSALAVLSSIIPTGDTEITEDAASDLLETISSLFEFVFTTSGRRLSEAQHRMLLSSTEASLVASAVSICKSLVASETEGYQTEMTTDSLQMSYAAYLGADLCIYINQAQSDDQISAGIDKYGLYYCSDGLEDDETYEICTFTFSSSDVPDNTISYVYKTYTDVRDDSSRRKLTDYDGNLVRIGFTTDTQWENETIYNLNDTCSSSDVVISNSACNGYTVSCPDTAVSFQLTCVSNSTYPVCVVYNNATGAWEDDCITVNYTSSEVYCDCGSSDGLIVAETHKAQGSVSIKYVSAPATEAPTSSPSTVSSTASSTDSSTVGSTVGSTAAPTTLSPTSLTIDPVTTEAPTTVSNLLNQSPGSRPSGRAVMVATLALSIVTTMLSLGWFHLEILTM